MPLAQTIGLETLSKYFHLPINDVAKELGVCATVLKKICRKNGIPRWPHRKIKSLDKMIMTLEVSVAKNPEDGERIRHEIHTLKNKKMFLMKNPNVLATKAPSMKKGAKGSSKNSGPKSPVDSPDSPSHNPGRGPPYQSFSYLPPYGSPSYSNNSIYGAYGTYSKNPSLGYLPYPSYHPGDASEHRRSFDSDECLSPSMVLDPVAAALFLQIPHPHLPHPTTLPRASEPTGVEKSQWVPGDHSSAFNPTKPLHSKYTSPSFSPRTEHFDDQARMVPQQSSPSTTTHSQQLQSSTNFLIHLPELKLPDEKDKPKLSTLEPDLFHRNGESPAKEMSPRPSLSPSNKWQLPEWFEAEHQQLVHKGKGDGSNASPQNEVRVPVSDDALSSSSDTPPISLGE